MKILLKNKNMANITIIGTIERMHYLPNSVIVTINEYKRGYKEKKSGKVVDDRIYNIYSALKAGIHAIRFRSEFTLPNPPDLKDIPEVKDIREFLQ